jgi:hypothetical protein
MFLEVHSNHPFEIEFNLSNHKLEFIIGYILVRPEEYFMVRVKSEGALILREQMADYLFLIHYLQVRASSQL